MKKSILILFLFVGLFNMSAEAQRASGARKGSKSESSSKAKAKQNDNKKLFTNIFWGGFIDYTIRSSRANYYENSYRVYNPITNNYDYYIDTCISGLIVDGGVNLFFAGIGARYNITELNNNSSIGINAHPNLNLFVGSTVTFDLNVPLFLSYNSGNVATYKSKKDNGWNVGLGWNSTLILSDLAGIDRDQVNIYKRKTYIGEPIFKFGYTFYNTNDIPREWSLIVGTNTVNNLDPYKKSGTKQQILDPASNSYNIVIPPTTRSIFVKIGYHYYLGY
jgi:hypothetical protein